MARHQIPIKDKKLVIKRLAEGASLPESIKGTSIKSVDTAFRIARFESEEIERLRANYLDLIEKESNLGIVERALLWGEMARATKPIGAKILVDKDGKTVLAEDEGVIEVPDWFNRREALKYIDSLAGLATERQFENQTNVQVNVSPFRGGRAVQSVHSNNSRK